MTASPLKSASASAPPSCLSIAKCSSRSRACPRFAAFHSPSLNTYRPPPPPPPHSPPPPPTHPPPPRLPLHLPPLHPRPPSRVAHDTFQSPQAKSPAHLQELPPWARTPANSKSPASLAQVKTPIQGQKLAALKILHSHHRSSRRQSLRRRDGRWHQIANHSTRADNPSAAAASRAPESATIVAFPGQTPASIRAYRQKIPAEPAQPPPAKKHQQFRLAPQIHRGNRRSRGARIPHGRDDAEIHPGAGPARAPAATPERNKTLAPANASAPRRQEQSPSHIRQRLYATTPSRVVQKSAREASGRRKAAHPGRAGRLPGSTVYG